MFINFSLYDQNSGWPIPQFHKKKVHPGEIFSGVQGLWEFNQKNYSMSMRLDVGALEGSFFGIDRVRIPLL